MKNQLFTTAIVLGLLATSPASAATDEGAVKDAFATWRTALSSQDPQKIVDLYEKDAILLATLADKPIKNQADRIAYFTTLMTNPKLAATVNEEYVRLLDENTALVSGIYTFSFEKAGATTEIPARYSFVFEKKGDDWLIAEHHSSRVPQL